MDVSVITSRLMRVLRFDASVYKEVAADQGAMPQAGIVVTLASIIAAIGESYEGVRAIIVAALVSIVGFFVYTAVATGVAKLFQGKTGFNEMGRTLGYAYAWYALAVLALVPGVGGLLAWLGWLASVVAGVIALRESAEFSTVKALITVVIAAIVVNVIKFLIPGL